MFAYFKDVEDQIGKTLIIKWYFISRSNFYIFVQFSIFISIKIKRLDTFLRTEHGFYVVWFSRLSISYANETGLVQH